MSNGVQCPLLLVALGDPATELAGPLLQRLEAEPERTRRRVAGLWVSAKGVVTPGSDGRPEAGQAIDGLRSVVEPGVWRDNGTRLSEAGRILDRELKSVIQNLQAIRNQTDVRSGTLQLVILTSMTDPVGSAATLAVIESLQRLSARQLVGFAIRRHLVCLSHGVERLRSESPETSAIEELRAKRAEAFLRELEWLFDSDPNTPPLESAWLVDSRGETDLFITSPQDLLPSLQRMLESLSQPGDRANFGVQPGMELEVGGRKARYGSFGSACLRFPATDYLRIVSGAALAEALDEAPVLAQRTFDAPAIFGEATRFLTDLEIDRLPDVLAADGPGGAAPRVPPFPRDVLADYTARPFLDEVKAWSDEIDRKWKSEVDEYLGARRGAVEGQLRDRIHRRLAERLEWGESGGLFWADAWLAALQGKASPWTARADEARGREIDQLILRPARDFFDPLLFADVIRKEGTSEAVEAAAANAAASRERLVDVEQKFRELEKSEATSRARILAVQSGEAIVERPDTPESLIADLEAEIGGYVTQRTEIEKLRKSLIQVVKALDEGRASAAERARLRKQALEEHEKARQPLEDSLNHEWARLNDSEIRLEELRRYLWIWLATRLGIALLGGGLATFLWIRFPFVRAITGILPLKVWVVIGILALIGLAADFNFRYFSPLRELLSSIRGVRLTLTRLRGQILAHHADKFRIVEKFARYGAVIELNQWIAREFETVRNATIRVRDALIRSRDEARDQGKRAHEVRPVEPLTAFDLVIDPMPPLPKLLEEPGRSSCRAALRKFWTDSPVAEWVREVVDVSRDSAGRTAPEPVEAVLDGRLAALEHLVRSTFLPHLDIGVEEAFARSRGTPELQRELADLLWIAAAPHASFAKSSGFAPEVTRLAVVGSPADGPVLAALRAVGHHTEPAGSVRDDGLHLLRISNGYPAFTFSPFAEMLPADADVFVVDSKEAATLPALKPQASHTADWEAYQNVVFALACGLAKPGEDDTIIVDGMTFDTIDALLADWATARGRSRRGQLEAQLDVYRSSDGPPSFRDRLAEGLAEGRVRGPEDREVVEEYIRLLDAEPG